MLSFLIMQRSNEGAREVENCYLESLQSVHLIPGLTVRSQEYDGSAKGTKGLGCPSDRITYKLILSHLI